jgi:hypothetical protein
LTNRTASLSLFYVSNENLNKTTTMTTTEINYLTKSLWDSAVASAKHRLPVILAKRESDRLTVTITATKITRRDGEAFPFKISVGYCRMGYSPIEVRSFYHPSMVFFSIDRLAAECFAAADAVTSARAA